MKNQGEKTMQQLVMCYYNTDIVEISQEETLEKISGLVQSYYFWKRISKMTKGEDSLRKLIWEKMKETAKNFYEYQHYYENSKDNESKEGVLKEMLNLSNIYSKAKYVNENSDTKSDLKKESKKLMDKLFVGRVKGPTLFQE